MEIEMEKYIDEFQNKIKVPTEGGIEIGLRTERVVYNNYYGV